MKRHAPKLAAATLALGALGFLGWIEAQALPSPSAKAALLVGTPGIPINSLPFTIEACGQYFLTDCLTGVSGSNGIVIDADDVTLDLNGFALLGVPGSLDGVTVTGGARENVTVKDGIVRGWGEHGIDLLRSVIRAGIDWSTVYRDYYIRREGRAEARKAREQFEEAIEAPTQPQHVIEEAVDYVQKELKQIAAQLPVEERRQVVSNITKAASAVLTTNKVRQEELRHLRLIASTSSLLLIFSHEVKSLLGVLDEYEMRLVNFARKLSGRSADQAREMRQSFRSTKERFLDLLGLTSPYDCKRGLKYPALWSENKGHFLC